MQPTIKMLDAVLSDLIATGGIFDDTACWMGLYTAINNQGVNTVLADLTQATGAMATRQPLGAWGSVHHKSDGRSVVDNIPILWSPASSSESQTVQGFFIADALTAGNLICFEPLANPLPMPDQFALLTIIFRLVADPMANWDATVIYNGATT